MLTEADDYDWQNANANYTHAAPSLDNDGEQADPESLVLSDFIDPSLSNFGIDYAATVDQMPMPSFTALDSTPELATPRTIPPNMTLPQTEATTSMHVTGTPATFGVPKGYAALRALQPEVLDANGKVVKKKGRPVGWRKKIHGKGVSQQRREAVEQSKLVEEGMAVEEGEAVEASEPVEERLEVEEDRPAESTNVPSIETNGQEPEEPSETNQEAPAPEDAVTPGPVGYAAFRQSHAEIDGKPVKKIGRPVGWRKSIHGRAATGLPTAKKGKGKGKKTQVQKESEAEVADTIMADVLASDMKFESKEAMKIEAPENTFTPSEDVNVDSGVQLSENTFSHPKVNGETVKPEDPRTPAQDVLVIELPEEAGPCTDDPMEEVKYEQPEDPVVLTTEETPMTAQFWAEVLEYASMVEESDATLEQDETERRDSILEVVQASGKQEASVATAHEYEVDTSLAAQNSVGDDSARPLGVPTEMASEPEERAAAKVFSIYELVERILSSLPSDDRISMKTVLQAQRVNKLFQNVINRSFKLQRLLYFKNRPALYVRRDGRPLLRVNPLFNFANIRYFQKPQTCIESENRLISIFSGENKKEIANGIVWARNTNLALEGKISRPASRWFCRDSSADSSSRGQSWRRMLICQGAIAGGQLTLGPGGGRERTVRGDVTMGQVWDAIGHDRKIPPWACGTCIECLEMGRAEYTDF